MSLRLHGKWGRLLIGAIALGLLSGVAVSMTKKSDLRLTIIADGFPRRVVSLSENKRSRDLYISMTLAARLRDRGKQISERDGSIYHGAKIISQKYSIHPTVRSADGNSIHLTLNLENGVKFERYHWTKAIKETNKFALLCGGSHPRLNKEIYTVPANKSNHSIGTYDPSKYTLVTFLLVSNRDRAFNAPWFPYFNNFQSKYELFNFTIVWTFLTRRSSEDGLFAHVDTVPVDIVSDHLLKTAIQSTSLGLDERAAIDQMLRMIKVISDEVESIDPDHSGRGLELSASGLFDTHIVRQ